MNCLLNVYIHVFLMLQRYKRDDVLSEALSVISIMLRMSSTHASFFPFVLVCLVFATWQFRCWIWDETVLCGKWTVSLLDCHLSRLIWDQIRHSNDRNKWQKRGTGEGNGDPNDEIQLDIYWKSKCTQMYRSHSRCHNVKMVARIRINRDNRSSYIYVILFQ